MLSRLIRSCLLGAALAVPLLGACIDDHEAEECWRTLTCPPDAGDGGDASTDAFGE